MRIFRCKFAKLSREHAPGPTSPKVDLWRNLDPLGNFLRTPVIARICKEKSIGLPWFSTKPQIMTSLTEQARPHPADIFNWTNNWTCFWKCRGELPGCFSSWLRDQLARLVSIT